MLHFRRGDHFHLHPINSEDAARIFAAALALIFVLFLATCALYLVMNIHDYYGS